MTFSRLSAFAIESIAVQALTTCIMVVFWVTPLESQLRTANGPQPSAAREMIGNAKPTLASDQSNLLPQRMLPHSKMAPSTAAPSGMVRIPGGEFSMGSDEALFADARPWHRVYYRGQSMR
jgi:formylglycine-generating enzyme required for sulfatase activity